LGDYDEEAGKDGRYAIMLGHKKDLECVRGYAPFADTAFANLKANGAVADEAALYPERTRVEGLGTLDMPGLVKSCRVGHRNTQMTRAIKDKARFAALDDVKDTLGDAAPKYEAGYADGEDMEVDKSQPRPPSINGAVYRKALLASSSSPRSQSNNFGATDFDFVASEAASAAILALYPGAAVKIITEVSSLCSLGLALHDQRAFQGKKIQL
jgi:hypothetical protein